ncbi:copper amine oxidase [Azotosporobacter soli]|uniref:copper amine oxidase n=1 Tax=Azotosporobacter soli TaxID=3055040 RepID=UPI0031FEEC49
MKKIVGIVAALWLLCSTLGMASNAVQLADAIEWPATMKAYGGKLLLSDSPETVYGEGVLYQDTVVGEARLFFHHVNANDKPCRIAVIVENQGMKTAKVQVLQQGLGGPGLDFLVVGKQAQMDYLKGGNVYQFEVPGRSSLSMSPRLDRMVVETNALVNGIFDFKTDRPVRIRVLMMPAEANPIRFAYLAQVLPADQYRLRGTFEGKDRLITLAKPYNAKIPWPVAVTLADNKLDPYQRGIDATDGSSTVNYGNYGVVYKVQWDSRPGDTLNYYLNPRGGEYAGGLGIKYKERKIQVPTPADRLFFGTSTVKESELIGSYEGGQPVWFTFSPPGASNLPVRLVVEPSR